jgi:hypothetical protein
LYLGLGFDGRLAENLFYKLVLWGEAGSTLSNNGSVYRTDTILAGMGDLSLKFFLKEALNSQFELGVNLSSGDLDFPPNFAVPSEANVADQNTFFSGITGRGGGYIHSMGYGNSLIPRFSYFFKPLSGRRGDAELGITLDYLGFFRIVNGYIAESILVSGTNQAYLGSEFDLKLSLRLVSDLGISLRGGVFLPNAQAITKMSTWKAGLELSLGM